MNTGAQTTLRKMVSEDGIPVEIKTQKDLEAEKLLISRSKNIGLGNIQFTSESSCFERSK